MFRPLEWFLVKHYMEEIDNVEPKHYPRTKQKCMYSVHNVEREKEGDLTQRYDKTPYTNRKLENQKTTHKRHQKLRLNNDCGPT